MSDDDYDEMDGPRSEDPMFITREIIDKLILERMPDRVEPAGDMEWLEEIIEHVGDQLGNIEAKKIAAEELVRGRYAQLTRKANHLIRKWHNSGQWPLDPMDVAKLPVALDGNGKKARLGAMTKSDYMEWATFQRDKRDQHVQGADQLIAGIQRLMDAIGDGVGDDYFKSQ